MDIDTLHKDYNRMMYEYFIDILNNDIEMNMPAAKKNTLLNQQKYLYQYMYSLNHTDENISKSRGLMLYHKMGSGKTITSIFLADACRRYRLPNSRKIYKRKIIILMPANLHNDPWIKELSRVCIKECDVYNQLNKITKNKKTNKKTTDAILKSNDYYIIHYNAETASGGYWDSILKKIPTRSSRQEKYTNYVSEDTNQFDDSVIIIDESHNIFNSMSNEWNNNNPSSTKLRLYKKMLDAKNSKFVILSGTPIMNKPSELSFLFNLLRYDASNKLRFPYSDTRFDNDFFNITNEKVELKNEKKFKRRINGLVSFYEGDEETFYPDAVIDNIYITMKNTQENIYRNALEYSNKKYESMRDEADGKDTMVFNSSLDKIKASNMTYPPYVYDITTRQNMTIQRGGIDINNTTNILSKKIAGRVFQGVFDKSYSGDIYDIMDNDRNDLHIDNNLKELSSKFYYIMKKINESNGPVVVFSRFREEYGVGIFQLILEQNGYNEYTNVSDTSEAPRYMTWTSSTVSKNQALKDMFNDKRNKNGGICKVFCMTESGKEGISIRNVRQMHILEPWWNNNRDKQVIGRAIRRDSHDDLEPIDFIDFRHDEKLRVDGKKLVNIFKYYSVLDERQPIVGKFTKENIIQMRNEQIKMLRNSIDCVILRTATLKEVKENIILKAIRENAIDCNLNEDLQGTCFEENKITNFTHFWDLDDDEYELLDDDMREYRKIYYEPFKKYFWIDQNNIIYETSKTEIYMDKIDINHTYVAIGEMKNDVIDFYSEYINDLSAEKFFDHNILSSLFDDNFNFADKTILDISQMEHTLEFFKHEMNVLCVPLGSYNSMILDHLKKMKPSSKTQREMFKQITIDDVFEQDLRPDVVFVDGTLTDDYINDIIFYYAVKNSIIVIKNFDVNELKPIENDNGETTYSRFIINPEIKINSDNGEIYIIFDKEIDYAEINPLFLLFRDVFNASNYDVEEKHREILEKNLVDKNLARYDACIKNDILTPEDFKKTIRNGTIYLKLIDNFNEEDIQIISDFLKINVLSEPDKDIQDTGMLGTIFNNYNLDNNSKDLFMDALHRSDIYSWDDFSPHIETKLKIIQDDFILGIPDWNKVVNSIILRFNPSILTVNEIKSTFEYKNIEKIVKRKSLLNKAALVKLMEDNL